jgi:hypothetical protein
MTMAEALLENARNGDGLAEDRQNAVAMATRAGSFKM